MTVHTTILTGKAAADAIAVAQRTGDDLRAEIDARGGKTYEGVILLPDGTLTSVLSLEDVDGD